MKITHGQQAVRPPGPRTATTKALGARIDAWPEYTGSSNALFVLFLAYVVFWYLQGGYRFPALGAIRLEFIMGAILAVASTVSVFSTKMPKTYQPSGILGWIVGLFVIVVIMATASRAPQISWTLLIDRVLKFAMMALFICAFVTSPTRLRWFLGAYLAAFFKMAQEGVLGLITGSLVWENQGTPRLHGATPNYTHPNSFSGTQLGTLPFLIQLLPLAGRWLRPVMILQSIGAVAIVITTGSRTGYVALVLWLLYVVYQSKQKARIALLLIVALLVAAPLVPPAYLDRFETIFTQEDKEGASIDMRKQILEDAWVICTTNPLGVGVGAFTIVRSQLFGRSQATHNLYLEVTADLGLQGLVAFLGLLVSMMLTARRIATAAETQLAELSTLAAPLQCRSDTDATRMAEHRQDLLLIRATAQAVSMFLIIRVGVGFFGHDFYEIYWWFAAGLLIALSRLNHVASGRTAFLINESGQQTAGTEAPKA